MTEMTIIMICHDCQQSNRQYLGTDGYEFLESEFTSLSEAHTHMNQYPYHYVTIEVMEKEDD